MPSTKLGASGLKSFNISKRPISQIVKLFYAGLNSISTTSLRLIYFSFRVKLMSSRASTCH